MDMLDNNNIDESESADGIFVCSCCKGAKVYDEGFGMEECSACSGTGYES